MQRQRRLRRRRLTDAFTQVVGGAKHHCESEHGKHHRSAMSPDNRRRQLAIGLRGFQGHTITSWCACCVRAHGDRVWSEVAFEPLQIGEHFCRALISQVAIFFERLLDEAFQLGRNVIISRTAAAGSFIRISWKTTAGVLPTKGGDPVAIS